MSRRLDLWPAKSFLSLRVVSMCKPASRLQLQPLALGGPRARPGSPAMGSGAPSGRSFATRKLLDTPSSYQRALKLVHEREYLKARQAFEETVTECPDLIKAWISWAQMEKNLIRYEGETGAQRFNRCREVLQRALTTNRQSSLLMQAWGLMELQKGNDLAAVMLLERCVQHDPRNQPVLRWEPVRAAQARVQGVRRPHRAGSEQ